MRATDIFRYSIITMLLIFVLSYNYHQLWIIYDVFILFLSVALFFEGVYTKLKNVHFLMFGLLAMLIFNVFAIGGGRLISWLSFWDTFKHLVLIIGVDYYVLIREKEVITRFIRQIIIFSSILFLIQIVFVAYQHFKGRHVDDVAGTFGDGSSHSIAYFSIFILVYVFAKRWSIGKLIPVVSIISLMNYWSENIGFFIILLLIGYYFLSTLKRIRLLFYGVGLTAISAFLFGSGFSDEFDEYQRRIKGFFQYNEFVLSDDLTSDRSTLMGYAIYEGGFLGKGPGYFSEIYSVSGKGVSRLYSGQINISEVSHLIAEYGLIGLFLGISIYVFIFCDVKKMQNRTEWIILFLILLTFFYNRFLMDERIIFFTTLTVFFLRFEQKKILV